MIIKHEPTQLNPSQPRPNYFKHIQTMFKENISGEIDAEGNPTVSEKRESGNQHLQLLQTAADGQPIA